QFIQNLGGILIVLFLFKQASVLKQQFQRVWIWRDLPNQPLGAALNLRVLTFLRRITEGRESGLAYGLKPLRGRLTLGEIRAAEPLDEFAYFCGANWVSLLWLVIFGNATVLSPRGTGMARLKHEGRQTEGVEGFVHGWFSNS